MVNSTLLFRLRDIPDYDDNSYLNTFFITDSSDHSDTNVTYLSKVRLENTNVLENLDHSFSHTHSGILVMLKELHLHTILTTVLKLIHVYTWMPICTSYPFYVNIHFSANNTTKARKTTTNSYTVHFLPCSAITTPIFG